MVKPLELGEFPFYWRTKKALAQPPHDVPGRLPFAFSYIEHLQLIIQKRDAVVSQWLEHVYKEDANVGYLQEGHALAESYGGEFIEFFRRASALLPKSPASAADIGCGGVYLLQKIRELGLAVKGIDPSPVTAAAGSKAGIEIIADFYPSPSLVERFDVLFHYDVLEHVEDPVSFLCAHHANLSADGALIFAVPDCTHHIKIGDVSMALHEHLNYFDNNSLENVVKAAGFRPLLLESSRHGGVLFCCAVPDGEQRFLGASKYGSTGAKKFEEFFCRANRALERFAMRANFEGCLGLYVPLRAFPYLGLLSESQRLRFFDDDPGLRGRYFDGVDTPVENLHDLIQNPPERVFVCSLAFADQIASRLPQNIDVVIWSALFS